MKSQFIVFEGLDGAGTTTQMNALKERLEKDGVKVWTTAEPVSESPTGRLIRQVLKGEIEMDSKTLACMYAADRCEHLFGKGGVVEHLKAGEVVLCDRYKYSSLAYQVLSCSKSFIERLNYDFLEPDKIIYIDTPVEECLRRIGARGEQKEIFEKEEILKKVKSNYDKIFSSAKCMVITINGKNEKENITNQIYNHLHKRDGIGVFR